MDHAHARRDFAFGAYQFEHTQTRHCTKAGRKIGCRIASFRVLLPICSPDEMPRVGEAGFMPPAAFRNHPGEVIVVRVCYEDVGDFLRKDAAGP